jgi:ketosteroid isomerase-like protein
MTESNVDVVRRVFELYAKGGIEAVLEVFDEELVIEIPPAMSAEPDTYHGHEGARRYFDGFQGMIADVRYQPIELIPVGDRVVARVWMGGRGASSGLEVGLEAAVLHELEGGKIVAMRAFPDVESARAAIARG